MTKLNWDSEGDEYVTEYRGLTIRAVRDENPENPFEACDGHWPMLTHYGRDFRTYDKVKGVALGSPLFRFSDAQFQHDQLGISKILQFDIEDFIGRKYAVDEGDIADLQVEAIEQLSYFGGVDLLRALEALYDLLGIPNLLVTSRGYCQGDYAELLIVATPEAQAELRARPADMSDEQWQETLLKDMQRQADLYGAWAWGNVYGYVVERDGEEVPDGSCWGFYGTDFAESGLEEAAIEIADWAVQQVKEAAYG